MNDKNTFFARWADFFIRKYKITILIIISLLIGGVFSLYTLVREGFPNIEIPLAFVQVVVPGSTSTDVESKVTKPIEETVKGLNGVENITSNSANNISFVLVEYENEKDFDRKIDELSSAVSKVGLPAEAEKPEIEKIAAFLNILVTVTGDYDYATLKSSAESVKDEISRKVSGIKEINVVGGSDKEINIKIDLKKLNSIGLTIQDLKDIFKSNNIILPGGSLEKNGTDFSISISSGIDSLTEVENITLGLRPDGLPIFLKDIAKISIVPAESESLLRAGYLRKGVFVSKKSVYILINKKNNSDIIEISNQIKKVLRQVKSDNSLPPKIDTFISYDDSSMVKRQQSDLLNSAWQGLLVIFLVLIIFVSLRASIVISAIIPMVLLSLFMIFRLFDLSLNVITLFSIILTLGILVDNAIVIVESIQYNMNRGYKIKEASIVAINEVGTPVFSATLTTIIVFIPMMFIGGLIGKFIVYIPYTVITAITSSFLIAITITPLVGKWIIRKTEKIGQDAVKTENIKEYSEVKHWRLIDIYGRLMEKTFKSLPRMIVIILIALFLFVLSMSIPITGMIKMEQFPAEDSEFFQVNMTFKKGLSFSEKEKKVEEIEAEIEKLPELVDYSVTNNGEDISFFITLTDPRERAITSFKVVDQMEKAIEDIQDAELRIIEFTAGPPRADYPIIVQINEDNLEKSKKSAMELAKFLRKVDGVKHVRDGVTGEEIPQFRINLDRQKMNNYGLVPFLVATQIRDVFQPEEATKVSLTGLDKSVSLTLDVENKYKDKITDLENLSFSSPRGLVRLIDIARINEVKELSSINRFNQKRFIQISALTEDDADNKEIEDKIKDYMNKDKLEELGLNDDAITFRGQYSLDIEALDKIYFLLILAIILVYIVLVAQFNSYTQPIIIMASIPLAIIGVFPGLYITNSTLTFLANLGVVALIGIVVNDAIVLVSYSNLLVENGMSRREALVEAGKIRFRPIFSTSLTTIGGLLPLTITLSTWRPIGTAVISGLIIATFGTLVVVPTIFAFMSVLWDKILLVIRKKPNLS